MPIPVDPAHINNHTLYSSRWSLAALFTLQAAAPFWYGYGRYMSDEHRQHRQGSREEEVANLQTILSHEKKQIRQHLKDRQPTAALREATDVWHSQVHLQAVKRLPRDWFDQPYIWMMVGLLTPIACLRKGLYWIRHESPETPKISKTEGKT